MSTRSVISLALARALASRPGSAKAATELLEAQGFAAHCCDVKHVSAHSLYFVRCGELDFTIKIKVD